MMNSGWPSFSVIDLLRPSEGWKTDHAILSTYSADLVVIVTALLAIGGCDLDHRKKGSRAELVRAIESLRDHVCVLAQAGRVMIPATPRPILKLLDRFVRAVEMDENKGSWHAKAVLVRYARLDDPADRQWRFWIGSRNLTRGLNWESGMMLMSRDDNRGQQIDGVAEIGAALAARANLPAFSTEVVGSELAKLTWECPKGVKVRKVSLLGPGSNSSLPNPSGDVQHVFVVSPFLDATTVSAIARWGNTKTRRTLWSTAFELQRLYGNNKKVFTGIEQVFVQSSPDLPGECAELCSDGASQGAEPTASEEITPAGLHAKLLYAAKGARRQLWIGSANATVRAWGHNFEIVAELDLGHDPTDAIKQVVGTESFEPRPASVEIDNDELAVEGTRKNLSAKWSLKQIVSEQELEIVASEPPPLPDRSFHLEVAVLGGPWLEWPRNEVRLPIPHFRRWQRANFLQIRLSRGEAMCAWLQVAPCDPPPDDERDGALIAQYLDPRTFLIWVKSILAEAPAFPAGGDWDGEINEGDASINDRVAEEAGFMPTVEEILRAWARNQSAFADADDKVKLYLGQLEQRAKENDDPSGLELLQNFKRNWTALASELR